MQCPFCGSESTKVVDKRATPDKMSFRRRRECLKCERRFTTYERTEIKPLMVIKKDGRKEPFTREKIKRGIVLACEKRPVNPETIEKTVAEIERRLRKLNRQEIPTKIIGEMVIKKLKSLDDVAYIRFASVYKEFPDVKHFEKEIKALKR